MGLKGHLYKPSKQETGRGQPHEVRKVYPHRLDFITQIVPHFTSHIVTSPELEEESGHLLDKVGWVSEMIISGGSGAMRKKINRNKGSSSEWWVSCSKT